VRSARQQHGLTQADLSRRSGIAHAHLGRIERGAVSPELRTVVKLARPLGMTPAELVALAFPSAQNADAS
jgi:transcriptional regulator with XRE-family HTH domain